MTPERWTEIAALYDAARARPLTARSVFLATACPDNDLRREVESLLARTDPEGEVEEPAEAAPEVATEAALTGQRLGAYELGAPIGAGSMGVVYRACDTRLGRDVAVKVLPEAFTSDPDRLRRFEREARILAALNHPNIATIYGIEEREGLRALVMELVEGPTLAQRLASGPLPLEEALEMARQIARALDASHEKGIVHRDLKPANIITTADGTVKVLDFGLAKAPAAARLEPASSDSVDATSGGRILGTPTYMSPEQARGHGVDRRTDIWAFGCVLYEMLTGRPVFDGANIFEITAGILERTPEWSALPPGVPVSIHGVLRHCLEKEPRHRLRDIGDALFEIEQVLTDIGHHAMPIRRRRSWRRPVIALAVPALVLALILAWLLFPGSPPERVDSVAVLPFVNATDDPNTEYLGDGLTESLINTLSRVPTLRIVPRSIVFRYKGQSIDPRMVGEQLDVRAVVVGRLERRGEATFVVAELIDTRTVAQLWGEQYRQAPGDIITVEDSIVSAIVDRLRPDGLSDDQKERLIRHYTEDSEVYRLYLRGRFQLRKGTEDGHNQAIAYFQQAIAKDPMFAVGYAGLSDAYAGLGFLGAVRPVEAFPKAKAAALTALEFDDRLGEAYSSLATVKALYERDLPGAELDFVRAMDLDPYSATTLIHYGALLLADGRIDEAIAAGERAQQIDPLSATVAAHLGYFYYHSGRYDDAIRQGRNSLDLDPNLGQSRMLLVYALVVSGLHGRDLDEALTMHGVDSDPSAVALARALDGSRAQARQVLAAWTAARPVTRMYQIAQIHARYGERDRAFEWLERAWEERQAQVLGVHLDPLFQALRGDPRFDDLVARLGLSSRAD